MKTILKWPGGKEKELPEIRKHIPKYTGRFIEPFVGGGAVFFDTENEKCCINDKSYELINLYNSIKHQDSDFIKYIQIEWNEFKSIGDFVDSHKSDILSLYHGTTDIPSFLTKYAKRFGSIALDFHQVFDKELKRNLTSKINRSHNLENEIGAIPDADRIENIECALKSAYYMYIRFLLNNQSSFDLGRRAAIFLFIREYCYSSMFRYNANGEFNVPYGGISYNRKDFQKKIDYILSPEIKDKLANTQIDNLDFEQFIDCLNLTSDDFIFLDPPYDSDFSTYAQNEFGHKEQIRLCDCLKSTKAKFLLIIKNTDFIYELYKDKFAIKSFDKKYLVSFMNRNDKHVKHLIITNY